MERKYRGVHRTRSGRYHALATGRPKESWHLGNWLTARDAAIAVDRATLYFERNDLQLNLPKESLRLGPASPEELARASRFAAKQASGSSSQYLGVHRIDKSGYWQAFAHVPSNGLQRASTVHLGDFLDERDAAIARDRFVLGLHGKDTVLNFPDARLKAATLGELREWARRRKHEPRAGRYEGVTLKDKDTSVPWCAFLRLDASALYLGAWRTPKEAAIAYDRAALHYQGEDAFLNFPKLRKDTAPASAEQLRAEATRKRKRKTSSRYIGVFWSTERACWMAVVAAKIEHRHLGVFADEKEAAIARDKEALRILGDEAKLNFHPRTGEEVFGLRLRDVAAQESSFRRRQSNSARRAPAKRTERRLSRR